MKTKEERLWDAIESSIKSLRYAASTRTDDGRFWQTQFANDLELMLKESSEDYSEICQPPNGNKE